MNDLIVNKSHIEKHCDISRGIPEDRFKPFLRNAQEIDLAGLICEDFYYDILKNYTVDKYQKLITGGEYTHDSKTKRFIGLEEVLAQFVRARILVEHPVKVDSFGVGTKTNNFSESTSLKDRMKLAEVHRERALKFFDSTLKYLKRTEATDFPDWNCKAGCNETELESANVRLLL